MNEAAKAGDQSVVLAIDAGGTYFKSALISDGGTVLAESFHQSPVCSGGTKDAIFKTYENVIRHGLAYARKYGALIRGIGVATPGPFDYERGISLMKHKFADIYGINLKEKLKNRLPEISGIPFRFRHDANSFLAGEIWQGAARGYSRLGGITLGTGIGASCRIGGKFINNKLGSPSPEVSVWNKPYRDGIVENYVSAAALITAYQRVNPHCNPADGAKGIADMAKAGEQAAMETYERFGADLGNVLTPWSEQFMPEVIVFGGQISKDFALFAPALRQHLQPGNGQPGLVVGALGTDAALYGAAM